MARAGYLGGLSLLAVAAVYFSFNPAHFPFPRCPFNVLTGLYCPGCGSQRATHALLHGHVVQAAGYNLLAVLAVPVLAIGAADKIRNAFAVRLQFADLLYRPWLGWLVVGLTLAFMVLRNLPGALGAWLAP